MEGKFSRIACSIDPPRHNAQAVWNRISEQLKRKWSGFISRRDGRELTWVDSNAILVATRPSSGFFVVVRPAEQAIRITNTWARHTKIREALVKQAAKEKNRQRAAQQATERQAAEREWKERIERIKRLEEKNLPQTQ